MSTLSGNAGPYMVPLGRGPLRRTWQGSGLIDVDEIKPKKKKKKKKVKGGGEAQLFTHYAGVTEDSFGGEYGKKRKWIHVTKPALKDNPEIANELWDMLELSYSGMGGHKKIKSASAFEKSGYKIYAIDVDNDPKADAFQVYREHPAGLKGVALGTDGGGEAKAAVKARSVGEYKKKGSVFGEVSGAIAHILLKQNVPTVNNHADVEKVLGKKVEWVGAHPQGKYKDNPGWYKRSIGGGGGSVMKILVGHPKGAKSEALQYGGLVFVEEAANEVDFDGYFVTVNGNPMFIGAKALLMKPKKPKNFKMKKVKKTKKDGTVYYEEKEPDAWVERKTKYKFAKTASMARNYDQIGKTLEREASSGKTDQGTAEATVLLLVHETGMRIGGAHGGPGKSKRRRVEGGAKSDEVVDTFGASTLQKRHVKVSGDTTTIKYIGKSGVEHTKTVKSKTLASSMKAFLGGKDSNDSSESLFSYKDKKTGKQKAISRSQCSRRLKKFNDHYTPKDMRTVRANIVASDVISGINQRKKPAKNLKRKEKIAEAKKLVDEIGEKVAKVLGNTPDVAIGSYVNPALVEFAVKQAGLV